MENTSSTPHSAETSQAQEAITSKLRESSDLQSKPDELSDDALEDVAGGVGHMNKRRAIRESI